MPASHQDILSVLLLVVSLMFLQSNWPPTKLVLSAVLDQPSGIAFWNILESHH